MQLLCFFYHPRLWVITTPTARHRFIIHQNRCRRKMVNEAAKKNSTNVVILSLLCLGTFLLPFCVYVCFLSVCHCCVHINAHFTRFCSYYVPRRWTEIVGSKDKYWTKQKAKKPLVALTISYDGQRYKKEDGWRRKWTVTSLQAFPLAFSFYLFLSLSLSLSLFCAK